MIDSIGIAQLAIAPAPVAPAPSSQATAVILPNPAAQATVDQVDISIQAAQQRQQPVQPKVEYADTQVLGTEAVSMYMVGGKLYTIYRDEVTNRVTYVPREAQVLSSGVSSPVNITA